VSSNYKHGVARADFVATHEITNIVAVALSGTRALKAMSSLDAVDVRANFRKGAGRKKVFHDREASLRKLLTDWLEVYRSSIHGPGPKGILYVGSLARASAQLDQS